MIERRAFNVALPHATLHGDLSLSWQNRGLVVFVSARGCSMFAAVGNAAATLQASGFSTLVIDLLLDSEAHFTDADTHLPHLTDRLLAVLNYLHREIEIETVADQPIGLIAAGATTPLAVRVAALRDKDIRAVVCHGGLVDLAGLQYLKVLQAPLMLMADDTDEIAANNLRRAIFHIPGVVSLELLPENGGGTTSAAIALAVSWFERYLHH